MDGEPISKGRMISRPPREKARIGGFNRRGSWCEEGNYR